MEDGWQTCPREQWNYYVNGEFRGMVVRDVSDHGSFVVYLCYTARTAGEAKTLAEAQVAVENAIDRRTYLEEIRDRIEQANLEAVLELKEQKHE